MPDFEKKLKVIAESQELAPADRLTHLLEGSKEEDELSLDELDLVSAAGAGSYQRFLDRLQRKG